MTTEIKRKSQILNHFGLKMADSYSVCCIWWKPTINYAAIQPYGNDDQRKWNIFGITSETFTVPDVQVFQATRHASQNLYFCTVFRNDRQQSVYGTTNPENFNAQLGWQRSSWRHTITHFWKRNLLFSCIHFKDPACNVCTTHPCLLIRPIFKRNFKYIRIFISSSWQNSLPWSEEPLSVGSCNFSVYMFRLTQLKNCIGIL